MVHPEVILAAVLLSVAAFSAIMICLCVDIITIIKSRGSTLLSRDSATKEQLRLLAKSFQLNGLPRKTSRSLSCEEADSNQIFVDRSKNKCLNETFPQSSIDSTLLDERMSEKVSKLNISSSKKAELTISDKGTPSTTNLSVVVSVHSSSSNDVITTYSGSNYVGAKVKQNNSKRSGAANLIPNKLSHCERIINSPVTDCISSKASNLKSGKVDDLHDLQLCMSTNDVTKKEETILKNFAFQKRCSCENCFSKEADTCKTQSYPSTTNLKSKVIAPPSTTLTSVFPQTSGGNFQEASFSMNRCNHSLVVKTNLNYTKNKPASHRHTPVLPSSLHGSGIRRVSPLSSSSPSPSSLSSSSSLSGSRPHRTKLEDIKEDSSSSDYEVEKRDSRSFSPTREKSFANFSQPLSSTNSR